MSRVAILFHSLLRLLLMVAVGLCLGAPFMPAAAAAGGTMPGMSMERSAPAAPMNDCTPSGTLTACAACAVVLPEPTALPSVHYANVTVFPSAAADLSSGVVVSPEPPIPR